MEDKTYPLKVESSGQKLAPLTPQKVNKKPTFKEWVSERKRMVFVVAAVAVAAISGVIYASGLGEGLFGLVTSFEGTKLTFDNYTLNTNPNILTLTPGKSNVIIRNLSSKGYCYEFSIENKNGDKVGYFSADTEERFCLEKDVAKKPYYSGYYEGKILNEGNYILVVNKSEADGWWTPQTPIENDVKVVLNPFDTSASFTTETGNITSDSILNVAVDDAFHNQFKAPIAPSYDYDIECSNSGEKIKQNKTSSNKTEQFSIKFNKVGSWRVDVLVREQTTGKMLMKTINYNVVALTNSSLLQTGSVQTGLTGSQSGQIISNLKSGSQMTPVEQEPIVATLNAKYLSNTSNTVTVRYEMKASGSASKYPFKINFGDGSSATSISAVKTTLGDDSVETIDHKYLKENVYTSTLEVWSKDDASDKVTKTLKVLAGLGGVEAPYTNLQIKNEGTLYPTLINSPLTFKFSANRSAAISKINIKSSNSTIKNLTNSISDKSLLTNQVKSVVWDGKNDNGIRVPVGSYSFEVTVVPSIKKSDTLTMPIYVDEKILTIPITVQNSSVGGVSVGGITDPDVIGVADQLSGQQEKDLIILADTQAEAWDMTFNYQEPKTKDAKFDLNVTGTGSFDFTVDYGDGSSGEAGKAFIGNLSFTHTYTDSKSYVVTAEVTKGGETAKQTIVYDLSQNINNFTVGLNASPKSPQVKGTEISFTVSATGGQSPYEYSLYYSENEKLTATSQTGAYTFKMSSLPVGTSTIFVSAKDSIGATAKSQNLTYTITQIPPPPATEICDNNLDDNNNGQIDENCLQEDPSPSGPPASAKIDVYNDSATPTAFNPLVYVSRISYWLSADAYVTVLVADSTGTTKYLLTDNEMQKKGFRYVWWNGTKDNTDKGDIVPDGNYTYTITATHPKYPTVTDSENGTVTVNSQDGGDNGNDIEGGGVITDGDGSTIQEIAQETMSGSQDGKTAGTGPEIFIYFLFPLAALAFNNLKFNKK